jgi:hypothetical protein
MIELETTAPLLLSGESKTTDAFLILMPEHVLRTYYSLYHPLLLLFYELIIHLL